MAFHNSEQFALLVYQKQISVITRPWLQRSLTAFCEWFIKDVTSFVHVYVSNYASLVKPLGGLSFMNAWEEGQNLLEWLLIITQPLYLVGKNITFPQ